MMTGIWRILLVPLKREASTLLKTTKLYPLLTKVINLMLSLLTLAEHLTVHDN